MSNNSTSLLGLDEVNTEVRLIFGEMFHKFEGLMPIDRPTIPKIRNLVAAAKIIEELNTIIREKTADIRNLKDTYRIMYSAAITVVTLLGCKIQGPCKQRTMHEPPWKQRLQKRINKIRGEIFHIYTHLSAPKSSKKVERAVKMLCQTLKISSSSDRNKQLNAHLEDQMQQTSYETITPKSSTVRPTHERLQCKS
ncbi:hypothetical protein HHI36_022702 [Cryptolaemus montrouzieri]|uniref:Uncharacterized protein n=1 Tax=Cryptolaemus montrouzieri TaxID=559131 RepID=A0ABD2N0I5_9CUCU